MSVASNTSNRYEVSRRRTVHEPRTLTAWITSLSSHHSCRDLGTQHETCQGYGDDRRNNSNISNDYSYLRHGSCY